MSGGALCHMWLCLGCGLGLIPAEWTVLVQVGFSLQASLGSGEGRQALLRPVSGPV